MRRACRWILASIIFLQTCHATTIVFVISKRGDYVVIAGDSRGKHTIQKQKPNDSMCKIIALEDTLFYSSGDVVIKKFKNFGPPWDARLAARETYAASNDHSAEVLSREWGERAKKWFKGLPPQDLEKIANPDGVLVVGGFSNGGFRNVSVFLETVSYDRESRLLSSKTISHPNGVIGVDGLGEDLVREFRDHRTPRAMKAWGNLKRQSISEDVSYDVEFARRAVQFVIDNAPVDEREQLHGPIDVAVVRRFGGIEWHPRKPNCYSQDLHSSREKKPAAKKTPSH